MKSSEHLDIGQVYTRKQLRGMFGIVDATINTGVFRPKNYDSLWLFVTENKTPDRTPYTDRLEDDLLYWQGQTSGRTDKIIVGHNDHGLELLLFYRTQKYEHPGAGFRFEGIFEYVTHTGSHPANFILRRVSSLEIVVRSDLEVLELEEAYFEGNCKQRFSNYYERDTKLRAAAILCHGTKCMVCGFDFESFYGKHGAGFIEVHHLRPVSSLEEKTQIDPGIDMAVVCSNCHRMLHRKRDKVLSLQELKAQIRGQF